LMLLLSRRDASNKCRRPSRSLAAALAERTALRGAAGARAARALRGVT
jgi:hypothetical protein